MAIMTCVCNHSGQDALHGYKRRVANETGASAKSLGRDVGHRCTVCGKDIIKPVKVKKVKKVTEPDKKKGR